MKTHVLCLLLVLASSACFHGVEHGRGVRPGLPIDDAWIQAAYAKSLREGRVAALHPGDRPSQGSTAPLWVVLLSGAQAVVAPFADERETAVFAARGLGILCAAAALASFQRILRGFGLGSALVWLTSAFLAFSGRFTWGVLSGLEVPLYVLATLLALERHLAGKRRGVPSRTALPIAALAGWSRPECFLLPFLLALDGFLFPGRDAAGARRPRWPALSAIALTVLILAGYVLLHLWAHGRPLPSTFYVKAEGDSPLTALAQGRLLAALTAGATMGLKQLQSAWIYFPGMLLPLILWLPAGARRATLGPERTGTALLVVLVAFPLLQGGVHFIHPENQVGRYFLHLLPPLLIVAALGAHELVAGRGAALRVGRSPSSPAWALLVPLPIVGGVLVQHGPEPLIATALYVYANHVGPLVDQSPTWYWVTGAALGALHLALLLVAILARPTSAPPRRRALWFALPGLFMVFFAGARFLVVAQLFARNVEQTDAVNVASALWVRDHTEPGDLIACHDLGALAYFGDRPLLDLQGIGSLDVLEVPRDATGRRDLALLILERRPRWYVGFPDWHAHDLARVLELAPEGTLVPTPRASIPPLPLVRNVTVGGTQMLALELTWTAPDP